MLPLPPSPPLPRLQRPPRSPPRACTHLHGLRQLAVHAQALALCEQRVVVCKGLGGDVVQAPSVRLCHHRLRLQLPLQKPSLFALLRAREIVRACVRTCACVRGKKLVQRVVRARSAAPPPLPRGGTATRACHGSPKPPSPLSQRLRAQAATRCAAARCMRAKPAWVRYRATKGPHCQRGQGLCRSAATFMSARGTEMAAATPDAKK